MITRTRRLLASLALFATLAPSTGVRAAETMMEFEVARADTLIDLSNSMLVSPTAWREVARINRLANPNVIRPGQRLRIPTRLLRDTPVAATLVSVSGDVRVDATAATSGSTLSERQSLETGPAGSAVVALADGSRVRIPPSSLAEVTANRRYGDRATDAPGGDPASSPRNGHGPWFASTLRLLRGSVEVFATKALRIKPLEVVTPTAVVGVRGTRFRVAFDEGNGHLAHGEVLEGNVRFDAVASRSGADLAAGYGASADSSGAPAAVARLLPAPDLSNVPERFERPIVRFATPPGPARWRVQIASDPDFERIVSDQSIPVGGEVRVAGLEDARWQLRARRIDVQGIEGLDATRTFVLKARPEPPVYRAPNTGAKQAVGPVVFSWAPNVEAKGVRLQIAEDPGFSRVLRDDEITGPTEWRVDLPQPGSYHWRLASVRPDGDQGPFGDAQRFELRPVPEPGNARRSADGNSLVFQWSGRTEDLQRVEFASDREFTRLVASAELRVAEWTLPKPASGGRYYLRHRSVEPDGFITPYSDAVSIDVPRDWSALGLLLPLLLLF